MSAFFAESSSSSLAEMWVVIIAAVGGVIVFVGLLIEKLSEKLDDRFLGKDHEIKAPRGLEFFGWCILMFGILVEIGVAIWSANDDWQTRQIAIRNDPWNGRILLIEARAYVRFKDDSIADLPPWGSSRVAGLMLCKNKSDSWAAPNFSPLSADKFARMGAVLFGGNTVREREYTLNFQSDGYEAMGVNSGTGEPVKGIFEIKALRIFLKFIPKNSEVLGGQADVIVNGRIHSVFQIPPQIDTNAINGMIPYTVIATNITPASEM
jgi:hypothetical protein